MESLIFDYITEKLNNVEKDPSDDISFYEAISSLCYTTSISDQQRNFLFLQLDKTKRSIPRYLESIFVLEDDSDEVCVCLDVCLYHTVHTVMNNFTSKIHGNGKIKVLAKLKKITDILSKISNVQKLDLSFNGLLYPEYMIFLVDCSSLLRDIYTETYKRIGIEDSYCGIGDE